MTRNEFKAKAQEIATARGWTLDIVEDNSMVAAWFSEPHPLDRPGTPYGADMAQAYMNDAEGVVGLRELS